jgi:hypothetical protein
MNGASHSELPPDGAIEWVTFRHPFTLPGLGAPHRPGTFEVRVRRERLDVSWAAYLLTRTIMLADGGSIEALEVRTEDLKAALESDQQ